MSIEIRRTAKTATFLSTASLLAASLVLYPGAVDADSVDQPWNAPLVTAGIDPVAQPDRQPEAAPQPAKPRMMLEMSQVEQIRVRVWGIADLGGEYAIDADNVLSIPRVGRIEVGKMKLAELESLLAEKLSEATRTDVTVAVEVARYRAYFIMGHVAEPGAIEWRPGLKVIQAISLARGVLRPSESIADNPVTHRQSRSQLTFALAQLARLKAERDGGDVVATTERIATMVRNVPEPSRLALTNLMSRQNDMLNEQRRLLEAQVDGLNRERAAANRELNAALSQEESVREQLRIARAQLTSIEKLKEKNLVTNTRYLDQKSNLLQAEVRHAEMASLLERARTRLGSVELQLATVPQQRRADLNERIDGLEREVAQLELATGIEASTDPAQEDVLQLRYHVARESASGTETIPATLFTEILPGDVLIVSQGQQDRIGVVRDIERRAPSSNVRDANAIDTQRIIEDSALHQIRRTSETSGARR